MSVANDDPRLAGPARDFIGYGRHAPFVTWPNGSKLVVNFVLNYEEGSEYSFSDGDGRNDNWGEYNLASSPDARDLGTETHFEYGSRAGVWRITRLFDRYKMPITVSACAVALERSPALVDWIKAGPHDVLGHGLRWTEYWTLSREEERRQLHEAVALFQKLLGIRPLGWNCRSFPSVNTRDLLIEEGGFLYSSDPCNDDIPYQVASKRGPFLIVPYSKTLNDSRYLVAPGYSNPRDFAEDCRSAIDYLADEYDQVGGRMLTIAVHARWTGQANRASGLRDVLEHIRRRGDVEVMARDDIARYWLEHAASFAVPGKG
jgi:peptidoglycan/xylan/chitin deacetylase (PgdA/CDA1 family)